MPRIVITIILLFFMFSASGQNGTPSKFKITGKVIDAADKKPVDYSTIILVDPLTSKVLHSAATDSTGKFVLAVDKAGIYQVKIDFIGYQPVIKANIKVDSTDVNLGLILLQPTSTSLKTVTITGTMPLIQNQLDKTVYNAAQDLTSQGGVATDLLRKIPQVSVDINGNVQLQGNGNIRFLINGKPSSIFGNNLADALQSIPVSQIQSVEMMTSPGAKYDAEGTGGIINIVLKQITLSALTGLQTSP